MRYYKPRQTPGDPALAFVVAAYLGDEPDRLTAALQSLLFSLAAQTHPAVEAVIVHDGDLPPAAARRLDWPTLTTRLAPLKAKFVETTERRRDHGHPHRRQSALELTKAPYVCFTNQDNWYVPCFANALLGATLACQAEFAYCDFLRSHTNWKYAVTRPKAGHIDLGCAVLARSLVERVSWKDVGFRGDGIYLAACAKAAKKTVKVDAALFVHN